MTHDTKNLGVICFTGMIDIPVDAIGVSLNANSSGEGQHIRLDLKAIRDIPVPGDAILAVELKDNIVNEPQLYPQGAWKDLDRSGLVIVKVPDDFYARRTGITIMIVNPATGAYLARSPQMHAKDATGDLADSGESYIKFRREPKEAMSFKIVLDPDGPVIEFGADGPVHVGESENSLGFFQYALPSAVQAFASALLLAKEGYDSPRWKKMKTDIARWASSDDWDGMKRRFDELLGDREENLIEAVHKVVTGFVQGRAYSSKLARLLAASSPETHAKENS
jgi:hypothetical protein